MVDEQPLLGTTSTPPRPSETDNGGAAPEVEADGDSKASRWAKRWQELDSELGAALEAVEQVRGGRRALICEMHDELGTYGKVAAVVGISRQRVEKIVKR